MRETGQTVVPMVASLCAVFTNFILNAILIFGLLGAPALGVAGAAIATVVSRFIELGILTVWGHTHSKKYPFLVGAFRSLAIPRDLFRRIIVNGLPLMANEFFWAIAMTMRNQSYSTRGLDVVAAQNIAMTIINLFNVIYMAVGSSIAIIVGKELGAGEIEKGKDSARKLMAFSISCAFLIEVILFGISSSFPLLYNTSDGIRELSTYMIRIMALALPFFAYANSAYFTLRSGGKVAITLLFDSVYMWSITIPVVFCLSRFTDMGIHWLFVAGTFAEVLKCVFGFILLKKVNWAKQLVKKQ
jgi:putative MATE family efflux protein